MWNESTDYRSIFMPQLFQGQLKKKRTVLVVEDDLTYFVFWNHIFNCIDPEIECHWAHSYLSAAIKIENANAACHPFEVVLCDIHLFGSKTGIELCEDYQSYMKTKFVLISGCNRIEQHTAQNLDTTQIPFLSKPLCSDKCIQMLKSIMDVKTMPFH